MLETTDRGNVGDLAMMNNSVLSMQRVLRTTLGLRQTSTHVRRYLGVNATIRILRQRRITLLLGSASVNVGGIRKRTTRLNALSPVNTAPRANLQDMTLSTVTRTRDAIRRNFRQREADTICLLGVLR